MVIGSVLGNSPTLHRPLILGLFLRITIRKGQELEPWTCPNWGLALALNLKVMGLIPTQMVIGSALVNDPTLTDLASWGCV